MGRELTGNTRIGFRPGLARRDSSSLAHCMSRPRRLRRVFAIGRTLLLGSAGLVSLSAQSTQTTVLDLTTATVLDTMIAGPADDPATSTRDEPNFNYDAFFAMNIRASVSTRQMGLLQFQGFISNLRIPPGSTITSATLRLYLNDDLTTGFPKAVRLHRMKSSWSTDAENPTTWNNPDNSFGTDGISLDNIEAAANASAEISLGQGDARFVTANVTADVQAWVNGTANFGWVIVSDNATDTAAFRSTNHAALTRTPALRVQSLREAVSAADVVFLATPFAGAEATLTKLAGASVQFTGSTSRFNDLRVREFRKQRLPRPRHTAPCHDHRRRRRRREANRGATLRRPRL